MSYILSLLLVLWPTTPAQKKDANTLADGVDQTFAKMRDFSADFVHTFEDSLNQKRQEKGHLSLARDRKMRWEYNYPEEKLLVSNGKTVYWFEPAVQQVTRDDVKNISDDQIPMMFLVGRSGLRDQFKQIDLFGTQVLRLTPRRKSDLRQIEIEVDPASYLVHRLVLAYSDGSRSEFMFTNIRTNIGLDPELFEFKVPSGVELVNGFGR